MKEIYVNKNDSGKRADRFLIKTFPALTCGILNSGIRKNKIRLNNIHLKSLSEILKEGDVFKLYFPDSVLEKSIPKNISKESVDVPFVVYEDTDILILDKPQGLLSHDGNDNLISRVTSYLIKKGEYNPLLENSFAPALCNRIDRNTRGLVVAAKNAAALRFFEQKIRDRKVLKYYLLFPESIPNGRKNPLTDWQKEEAFIFKDERLKRSFVTKTSKKGSKAIGMYYRMCGKLAEVKLITGRTHQIRAHFAYLKAPLMGDGKYGKSRNSSLGQALLSYKIQFDFDYKVKEIAINKEEIRQFFLRYGVDTSLL